MTRRRTPSAPRGTHEITREHLVKADHFRSIDCYVDYFGDAPAPRPRHGGRPGFVTQKGGRA